MANRDIGRVIANFDIDNRRSGYGRGLDDDFVPDIERLDGEPLKDRRPVKATAVRPSSALWLFAGLFAVAIAVFAARRKTRS